MTSGDSAPFRNIAISERYRVLRELGHGGMATVYAALDSRYDREVAVKVLDPDLSAGLAAERFLREIAAVAKLTHPHIVPLLDSGDTAGRLWFVMPLLEGDSLRARLIRDKQLPVGEAVRIAREVAAALAYAHGRGVMHRDIKPENILLSGGSAAVADFGLVKMLTSAEGESLTKTGIAVGTTLYMSPEQASGAEAVDARSDIYSLGCMLYEMLAGEPPFTGSSPQAVMSKHFLDPVPRAGRLRGTVPPDLDDVIGRAMAKLPADRWPDANAFAEALGRVVTSGSHSALTAHTPVRPVGTTPRLPAHSENSRAIRRTRPAIAASLAIAVAIALIAWRVVAWRAAAPSGAPRSIAVLPFQDLSATRSDEYFSTGMTDELLGALSSISGLRVAARNSSYAFKDRVAEYQQIGAALKVDALLEGSVRREGDQVRVLAQLVSVADGSSLWSSSFQRTRGDVFALQEEIARAIVTALQLTLAKQQTLVQQSTHDVEAYDLYLKGRAGWTKRTPASLLEAEQYFKKAVDKDPTYARAWAGLADVYIVQALNYFAAPGENFALGKAAALKALALDSMLAEAHASLGTVHFYYDRDWDAANASYRRAIALDPNYPTTHYFYALFLSARRDPAAMAEAEKARALDPLSPPVAQGPGIIFVQDARYSEAIAPLRVAIALNPRYYFPHNWLSIALAHSGAKAEALAESKLAVELAPDNMLAFAISGYVDAVVGERSAAVAVITKLDAFSRTRTVPYHYVARIYDALGDTAQALRYTQRAVDAGEGQLSQLRVEPRMHTIEKDPRFQAILKRLNIR